MRDVIHHIDAGDVLLFQEIDRLAFLFRENSNQHIGAGHF